MKKIESLENKMIKGIEDLKDAKNRKKLSLFIVDGKREILLALKKEKEIKYLLFCLEKSRIKEEEKNKLFLEVEKLGGEVIIISEKVLNKLSIKENPEEILAVFKEQEKKLEDIKIKNKESLVVLEGIEKPGNIGAVIRTAYAAGINNIILNNCLTDVYNPNIIRSSEGLIFFVNIVKASPEETVNWLKKNKITSFAAETKAQKKYSEVSFLKKSAIILGSEAQGLSEYWLKAVDQRLKIPMIKEVDSLNISVAAAILIYEIARQKSFNNLS